MSRAGRPPGPGPAGAWPAWRCGSATGPIAAGAVMLKGKPVTLGAGAVPTPEHGSREALLNSGRQLRLTRPDCRWVNTRWCIIPPMVVREGRAGPYPRVGVEQGPATSRRSTAASAAPTLMAAVNADNTVHDFDMKP